MRAERPSGRWACSLASGASSWAFNGRAGHPLDRGDAVAAKIGLQPHLVEGHGDHGLPKHFHAWWQSVSDELQPNANKTKIEVMPGRLELEWVGRIRRFEFSDPATRGELLAFFDLAFSLANENPEQLVDPYAIRRLHSVVVNPIDHDVLLRLLIQAVLADASSIMDFLRAATSLAEEAGWALDLDLVEEVINRVIERSGNRGYGNEVAWALWGALVFEVDIQAPACRVLQSLDDPFVALLALDARRQGRLASLDTSRWRALLDTSELYGAQWLLVYEGLSHGFLRPAGGGDPIGGDAFFSALRARGVRFYNVVQPATEVPDEYEDLTPDTVS